MLLKFCFMLLGGRTPFTWYPQAYVDEVPMTDMNMRANTTSNFPGRTYRFYTGNSIYEFGHGLSYSTFSNFIKSGPSTILVQLTPTSKATTLPNIILSGQAIDLSTINCNNLTFDLVIDVRNNGPRDGTHVVLVFWKPASSTEVSGAPNVQLVGFESVEVKRGKTESVTVKVDVCKGLSVVDSERKRKLVTGEHTILVGSSTELQVRHHFIVRLAAGSGDGGMVSL